jgi:hypothetical protein
MTVTGSNEHVSVPDAASLRPALLAVEARVNVPSSAQDWDTVLMKSSDWNWTDGYRLHWGGGYMRFWVNNWNGSSPVDFVDFTPPYDQWAHIVGTYDGSNVSVYVNGTLAGSVAYSGGITHTTNRLYIGTAPDPTGNPDPNGVFAGDIDEVALYNRALSATKIQLHRKSGHQ